MGEDLRAPFGSAVQLAVQLRRFCRQIEGDLWRLGTDLRDLFRPGGGRSRLTWRRLDVLLDALPGDGLYKTAVLNEFSDDELAEMAAKPREGHSSWNHLELLVAELIDRVGLVAYGLRVWEKPPEPYRRPGVVPHRRRKVDPEARARLRAIAEEHARIHGYEIETPLDVVPDVPPDPA
jgi:hypothetical protein